MILILSPSFPILLAKERSPNQLALFLQGKVEVKRRAKAMVSKMDELVFDGCTNTGACEEECPKNISIANIARLNREYLKARLAE